MVGQIVTIAVGQTCDDCGGVATVMINRDNCEKVACMLVIVL